MFYLEITKTTASSSQLLGQTMCKPQLWANKPSPTLAPQHHWSGHHPGIHLFIQQARTDLTHAWNWFP